MANKIELRPTSFNEYLGQQEAKDLLQIKVAAQKKTRIPMGHLLFLGASGLGKTTLANVVARELGVKMHVVMAPNVERVEDITDVLYGLQKGDILFIDEIHALNPKVQEVLYRIMEDFKYEYYHKGYKTTYTRELPRFTLIGATTHAGDLNAPLLQRFQDRVELSPYTNKELIDMINTASKRMLGFELNFDVANMMAKLSRRTARHAYSLLQSLKEMAEATVAGNVTDADMSKDLLVRMLKMKRIDPLLGLDAVSRKYLTVLIREQVPCGLRTLATLINEQDSTISYMVEPTLFAVNSFNIDNDKFTGALARPTKAGRVPTEIAERYIRECIRLQAEENWFASENLSIRF